MTDAEKNNYKILARKYNSSKENPMPLKQINDVYNNSFDFWHMEKYLTEMFECIPNKQGKNYHIKIWLNYNIVYNQTVKIYSLIKRIFNFSIRS